MKNALKIAITADLHWGVRSSGDDATRLLVSFLNDDDERPDLLILAGDIGASKDFGPCLDLFADIPCRKALVPGNHDIWVQDPDPRGDSWNVYENVLAEEAERREFHYLDHGPLLLDKYGLAIVGSMNWYDYSWSIDQLREDEPDWEEKLRRKQFTRGRHNDGRFVRWEHTDVSFTEHVVAKLERQLASCWRHADRAIVITHHPAFYGLNFPRDDEDEPLSTDALLWDAFSGNQALETILENESGRIPFIFSGHTHRQRENRLGQSRGYNIGGDYHFKRLLIVDWPAGTVTDHTFGNPHRR
ncbi:MAG TPA: metallophosphoesterase [Gemmataceae bacterium]|jgi:predicted phosphohydrolase|nr:metallophosphoesterase [Gemmataceae bacterium]